MSSSFMDLSTIESFRSLPLTSIQYNYQLTADYNNLGNATFVHDKLHVLY